MLQRRGESAIPTDNAMSGVTIVGAKANGADGIKTRISSNVAVGVPDKTTPAVSKTSR